MLSITVVAAVALLVWPLITILLFAILGARSGLIWATLLGYLFLPERVGFDLPALPPYTKHSAISYSLLLAALLFDRSARVAPRAVVADFRSRNILFFLTFLLMTSPVFTLLTNRSPILNGGALLPGMGIADFLVMFTELFVTIVPFFLARRWLSTPAFHEKLLVAVVILSVIYSFLAFFEIRMSPQLNRWVYGFFPHNWGDHVRGNGFRPLVFLDHGLSLGFLLFTAVVASGARTQELKGNSRVFAFLSTVLLFATLLLSRNLGAVMLVLAFGSLLFLVTSRTALRAVACTAFLFLSYPLVRDYAPIDAFTNTVANFAPDRAASLNYRLRNETDLLDRVGEKPLFGWGGYSRNHIFDDNGKMLSVTDGTWIVVLGSKGWVGYFSFFGLLCLPLISLGRAARRKSIPRSTVGLALIGAGNLVYLIPNSTLSPLSWMIFGAIAGFVERDGKSTDNEAKGSKAAKEKRKVRYTRFEVDTSVPKQPEE